MKTFTLLLASLLAAMLPGAKGFSAAPMTSFSTRRIASSTGTSALASSNAVFIRDVEKDESTYRYLLAQARECAFSDRAVTDPRDAKRYLMQILELESGCASGTLSGSDICNNIEELVDIVAHLRQKVEQPHVIVRYEHSPRVVVVEQCECGERYTPHHRCRYKLFGFFFSRARFSVALFESQLQ